MSILTKQNFYKILLLIFVLIILIIFGILVINTNMPDDNGPSLATPLDRQIGEKGSSSGHNCDFPKKPKEGCLDRDENGPLSQTRTLYTKDYKNCDWEKHVKTCDSTCPRPETFSDCFCSEHDSINLDGCVPYIWVETGLDSQCRATVVNEITCSDRCPKPIPRAGYCEEIVQTVEYYDSSGGAVRFEINYGVGSSKTWIEESLNYQTCEIEETKTTCSDRCDVLDTEPLACFGTDRIPLKYDYQKCEWVYDGTPIEENSPECIGNNI